MIRLKRVETLSAAAGWNVPLCLGMFAGLRFLHIAFHNWRQKKICLPYYTVP